MKRKKERILVQIMGIWQIIDGMITILFYGLGNTFHIPLIGTANVEYLNALNDEYGGVFLLICSFGVLLMGLGLINLLLAKRYIKDNQEHFKIGIFLLGQGLLSYFIMDIPSLVLGMTTGVLVLAKNKSIHLAKTVGNKNIERKIEQK